MTEERISCCNSVSFSLSFFPRIGSEKNITSSVSSVSAIQGDVEKKKKRRFRKQRNGKTRKGGRETRG
jgi:hypothetical protein